MVGIRAPASGARPQGARAGMAGDDRWGWGQIDGLDRGKVRIAPPSLDTSIRRPSTLMLAPSSPEGTVAPAATKEHPPLARLQNAFTEPISAHQSPCGRTYSLSAPAACLPGFAIRRSERPETVTRARENPFPETHGRRSRMMSPITLRLGVPPIHNRTGLA
jgi:hypothetical protein